MSNLAQSIIDRLKNVPRSPQQHFNDVLHQYTLERFLYRLSCSEHRDDFVLKGGLLVQAAGPEYARVTKDIDLVLQQALEPAALSQVFSRVAEVEFRPDGIAFDPSSVRAEPIKGQTEDLGVRVRLAGALGNARLAVQVDVGVGDSVVPPPRQLELPSLLGLPAPKLAAYCHETVIAEKLHAMVSHGSANTRLKDFYDVWKLSGNINRSRLVDAVCATFERRGTTIPDATPVGLQRQFAEDPQRLRQWRTFAKQARLDVATLPEFPEVVRRVRKFATPVFDAVRSRESVANVERINDREMVRRYETARDIVAGRSNADRPELLPKAQAYIDENREAYDQARHRLSKQRARRDRGFSR